MARNTDQNRFCRRRWFLPPTHNSDHRALVVKLATEGKIKPYRVGSKRISFQKIKNKEMMEGEAMFNSLEEMVDKPQRQERKTNSWIQGVRMW